MRNRKLGRRDGKAFIIRASLYCCKDFLELLLWCIFSSHQTWKEIPNWMYSFFLISVYKGDMVAWLSTEWRRTSMLLFTNFSFDICMDLYSKELATKIASGLIICHIEWERFAVGCSSDAGFWANTRFLLLGEWFLLSFLHWLVIIDISISPCSLLDFLGRSYASE